MTGLSAFFNIVRSSHHRQFAVHTPSTPTVLCTNIDIFFSHHFTLLFIKLLLNIDHCILGTFTFFHGRFARIIPNTVYSSVFIQFCSMESVLSSLLSSSHCFFFPLSMRVVLWRDRLLSWWINTLKNEINDELSKGTLQLGCSWLK